MYTDNLFAKYPQIFTAATTAPTYEYKKAIVPTTSIVIKGLMAINGLNIYFPAIKGVDGFKVGEFKSKRSVTEFMFLLASVSHVERNLSNTISNVTMPEGKKYKFIFNKLYNATSGPIYDRKKDGDLKTYAGSFLKFLREWFNQVNSALQKYDYSESVYVSRMRPFHHSVATNQVNQPPFYTPPAGLAMLPPDFLFQTSIDPATSQPKIYGTDVKGPDFGVKEFIILNKLTARYFSTFPQYKPQIVPESAELLSTMVRLIKKELVSYKSIPIANMLSDLIERYEYNVVNQEEAFKALSYETHTLSTFNVEQRDRSLVKDINNPTTAGIKIMLPKRFSDFLKNRLSTSLSRGTKTQQTYVWTLMAYPIVGIYSNYFMNITGVQVPANVDMTKTIGNYFEEVYKLKSEEFPYLDDKGGYFGKVNKVIKILINALP